AHSTPPSDRFLATPVRGPSLSVSRAFREVAQVSNLRYRRIPSCKAFELYVGSASQTRPCRLEIGDTAGWKPALRVKRFRGRPMNRRDAMDAEKTDSGISALQWSKIFASRGPKWLRLCRSAFLAPLRL